MAELTMRDRMRGCLLGGAVGDALGAQIEFADASSIAERFGPAGPAELGTTYGRAGAFTDDTQMTLFTVEGLLRADSRLRERGICDEVGVVLRAYFRWLHTQGERVPEAGRRTGRIVSGWLISAPEVQGTAGARHQLPVGPAVGLPPRHRRRSDQRLQGVRSRHADGAGRVVRAESIERSSSAWRSAPLTQATRPATCRPAPSPQRLPRSSRARRWARLFATALGLLAAWDGHDETMALLEAARRCRHRSSGPADLDRIGGGDGGAAMPSPSPLGSC
ncbi:MAG: ADP-ribosylglycohydrolase family protein [Acidimicrobiales bacterium]